MTDNPMKEIRVAKVTLNFGAGVDQSKLDKGVKLLKMITGIEPVKTYATKRIPSWGVRPGLPIGAKITLRGQQANQVLARLLKARDDILPSSCFDDHGMMSFGIKEYIDIPEVNYDQQIGIIGLQATVTLERRGYRVKQRSLRRVHVGSHHRINKEDAITFAQEKLNIKVE